MGIAVERQISFHACFPSGHHKETNFIPSSLPVWPPKRQKNTWVLGLVRQGPRGAWFYILSEWWKRNAGISPATRRCFSLKVASWPALENYSAFFQTSLQSLNSCILGFIAAVLPDSEKSLLPSGRRCSITNVSSYTWFSLHVGHVLLTILSRALGS